MNILITGAAGFIGSNLCEYFLKKDHNVIGIDNFITGTKSNISNFIGNTKFKFIEHDVCEKLNINEPITHIFHFASPASPNDYMKMPISTLRIGSVGTENILNFALKKNAKILVASTSEVYGDPLVHPQSENYFGNVNSVGPRGVYDEAKRYLEALTTAYNTKLGLDVRIARIFNTYGPKMRKDDGRAIPNFINQALNDEGFTIYGDGTQTRSFCYVDDMINGIYKLMFCDYKKPVNLGNPNEISILELTKVISRILGTKSNYKYELLPENDPLMRKPDILLAKNLIKWEPYISLEDGLLKTINFFKKLK